MSLFRRAAFAVIRPIVKARKQQAAWFFEVLWAEEWRASRPKVLKFTTGLSGKPRKDDIAVCKSETGLSGPLHALGPYDIV